MACAEIDKAIAWAKQSTGKEAFPVIAYLTKHTGVLTDPSSTFGQDYCWYAVGEVKLNAAGHLVGDLQLYANGGAQPPEPIVVKPGSTVGVEISSDGTVTYQQKINNKAVGGLPPKQVTAICVGGVLLTGTNTTWNEVVAVGVRREPSSVIPW